MMKTFVPPVWCGFPPDFSEDLSLEILKGPNPSEQEFQGYLSIAERTHYVVGRWPSCDIIASNNSISRQHAVIVHHKDDGVYVYDLASTHGTFIDGQKIYGNQPMRFHMNSTIRFGVSSRIYRLCLRDAAKEDAYEKKLKTQKIDPRLLREQTRVRPSFYPKGSITIIPYKRPGIVEIKPKPQIPELQEEVDDEEDEEETASPRTSTATATATVATAVGNEAEEESGKGNEAKPSLIGKKRKKKRVSFDMEVVLKDEPFDISSKKGKFEGLVTSEIVHMKAAQKSSLKKHKKVNFASPRPPKRIVQQLLLPTQLLKTKKIEYSEKSPKLSESETKADEEEGEEEEEESSEMRNALSSSETPLPRLNTTQHFRPSGLSLYGSLPAPRISAAERMMPRTPTTRTQKPPEFEMNFNENELFQIQSTPKNRDSKSFFDASEDMFAVGSFEKK